MYVPPEIDISDAQKDAIPEPKGYRILVAIPQVKEKTDGGVFIPDKYRDLEKTASVVGLVMALGESAYADEARFPEGPWCKEGDYVIFRSYSGTRIKVGEWEFRIINDDTVEAVVTDPRNIARGF